MTDIKQKTTPNLWFDREAEEAANFYASVFGNARVGEVVRATKAGFDIHGLPEGTVMGLVQMRKRTRTAPVRRLYCVTYDDGPCHHLGGPYKYSVADSLPEKAVFLDTTASTAAATIKV